MNRIICLPCFVLLLLIASAALAQSVSAPSADEKAIQESARAFVTAYDAGDAKAVAALWTDNGEYVVGKTTIKGRPEIQKLYEKFFRANPGSKMEVTIDSIRIVAPNVAIEQGRASVSESPNGPPSSSGYTAIHVKKDGKWQMASVVESEQPAHSDEDLNQLAWLIGKWSGAGDMAKVDATFDWMGKQSFIRGDTTVVMTEGGDAGVGGTQIIGRDPMTGQIVSWFFHAHGGHGYGVWTRDGNRWLIRTQGALADGSPTSATNILYHADDNVLSWQSVNRSVAGQPLPNTKELVLERTSTSAVKSSGGATKGGK